MLQTIGTDDKPHEGINTVSVFNKILGIKYDSSAKKEGVWGIEECIMKNNRKAKVELCTGLRE